MNYYVIGIMSGTSLDGVDIAYCKFSYKEKWTFEIIKAKTYPYDERWREALANVERKTALELASLDAFLGKYIGKLVNLFIDEMGLKGLPVDAVASHGHTVFHRPDLGFSTQIGSGAHILAETGITTITDFRSVDVALGGEGAPLVPIGDRHLFSDYTYCLNLGGIANISIKNKREIEARDIAFANMAGNYLCETIGLSFDAGGELAKSGYLHRELLEKLNGVMQEFKQSSLGKEQFLKYIVPVLSAYELPVNDKLHTLGEYIALQVSKNIDEAGKLLVTGGGAYNEFWMERIKNYSKAEVVVSSSDIIDYKEALIFAFLGVLRLQKKVNCLKSVTRALYDNVGGCVYENIRQ